MTFRTPGVAASLALCLLLAACGDDPSGPPPGSTDLGPPADLTISYVQRLPEMEYVWNSPDPAREGWPAPGQEVTWRGHVKNWADEPRDGVGYRWLLDGREVAAGTVDLPADDEATVDFPWSWTFERHRLALEIDPDDRIEEEDRNNRRELVTDALSVGFWVERGLYDHFAEHQRELGVGSTSFEDWAHRQIERYNELFREAIYPETPDGVLDRLRLDRITVVPDDALPLHPVEEGEFGNFDPRHAVPDRTDRTVDLQWGFPASAVDVYRDHATVSDNNQFYYSGFVQHELGHARYLVDVYGFSVRHGVGGHRVEITEDGAPVPGSRFMPGKPVQTPDGTGLTLHRPQQGLMNSDWTFLDRHSAGALNRIAGHRAVAGNMNEPENLGAYLNDLPARNRLTVTDADGEPLPGASVRIYRSAPDPRVEDVESPYKVHIDDTPDLELVADDRGRVPLGRNPFSGEAPIRLRDFTNAVVAVRVEHGGRVGYGFLDVTGFNQAYWRGETELADHTLAVRLEEL